MMINDNPVSWLILLVVAICIGVALFKAWHNSKPRNYWTRRDNFGCVSSMKRNLDWGNNKKRSLF